ncbi:MAG: ceramidase domain-containing protein [Stagnimonas sp.]|nr:ceramidase domain-containing protein [Stagnimonas sp.]
MAWSDSVDIYCERLGPGLWAEPLNALSNLGFVLAGLWLLDRAARRGEPALVRALAVLIVLIGVGSASFHTVATRWAEVLDVAFIGLFIYWFVACYARYRWAAPWWLALLSMGAFHAFGLLLTAPFAPEAFNGSVAYFPALAGLVIFGLLSTWKDRSHRARLFFAAALVFGLSLALRTLDQRLCASWPYGTHWAWHLLNALTLTLASLGISQSPGLRLSRL